MGLEIKTTGETALATDSNLSFVNFDRMVKEPTDTLTSKNRGPCFNCSYTAIESLSLQEIPLFYQTQSLNYCIFINAAPK